MRNSKTQTRGAAPTNNPKVVIAMVSLFTASFLLAGSMTSKAFEECKQSGKYTVIECEKLHLG